MMNRLDINNKRWGAISFFDIFDKINIAKSSDSNALTIGNVPFIGRSSLNNGFQGEYAVEEDKAVKRNCITINMVGEPRAFYQEFNFTCSQNILILRNDRYLNKSNSQFLCSIINKFLASSGYGYGYPVGLARVKRNYLLIPLINGSPNWKFMEDYIKQERQKVVDRVVEYYINKNKMINLSSQTERREYKEFWLDDIVSVKSGVRLTKANQESGKRPFIGASDSNNGVTNFVNNMNNSKDKNILGVNYNGSVVENFYHPYEAIFSDDVKRLEFKDDRLRNKYCYLFLKQSILMQKEKYTYGYKFNADRMRRQKVLLPVDSNGDVDHLFMLNSMRQFEKNKNLKIIEYYETKQKNLLFE